MQQRLCERVSVPLFKYNFHEVIPGNLKSNRFFLPCSLQTLHLLAGIYKKSPLEFNFMSNSYQEISRALIISLVFTILFSSCASSFFLQRKYSPGVYANQSGNIPVTYPISNKQTTNKILESDSVAESPSNQYADISKPSPDLSERARTNIPVIASSPVLLRASKPVSIQNKVVTDTIKRPSINSGTGSTSKGFGRAAEVMLVATVGAFVALKIYDSNTPQPGPGVTQDQIWSYEQGDLPYGFATIIFGLVGAIFALISLLSGSTSRTKTK